MSNLWKGYCDHTPAQRGQSHAEMMADCYGVPVEEYMKEPANSQVPHSGEETSEESCK